MPLDKDTLFEQYVKQKKSIGDIALEFKSSRPTVYRLLKKFYIRTRTKSEASLQALKSNKFKDRAPRSINENFFNEDNHSPGMFWVLGLLFADGNLERSRPVFSLSQREASGLEKVLKLLNSNAKIAFKKKTKI